MQPSFIFILSIEFTVGQLMQLQEILLKDLMNSVANGSAFQESEVTLIDIFEGACKHLDSHKSSKSKTV